jgi:hypothetical protein
MSDKTMEEKTAEMLASQAGFVDRVRREMISPEIARSDEPFTNQKPRIATEHDCRIRWRGAPPGRDFRCYMCGHKFEVGDGWRWIWATYRGVINPIVCEKCDGPDVLERWLEQNEEAKRRFWWFRLGV